MKVLDKIPKWVKFVFKLTITIAALAIVIIKIDFQQIKIIIIQSNWWFLAPAIGFFALSKVIASFRLNHFFRNIQINISDKNNLKLYWLGMFYNLFLPGGISGDGYKIYILNKKFKSGAKRIFQAVLLDRISGLLALITLAVILSIVLPLQAWMKYLIWFCIPGGYIIYYFALKKLFYVFVNSFPITSFLSLMVQLSQLISVYFIIKALQIDDHWGIYLFIFLISSIVATIPFTVGGVGAREITFLYATNWLHLELEPAISLSFLFFSISSIVSLYGLRYNLIKNFEEQIQ
jgi:uncharacterized membrane protein YbhN (UPF0104 family)